MDSKINNLVPKIQKPVDLETSVTFDNRKEALDPFKRAYKRMLNINLRHKLTSMEKMFYFFHTGVPVFCQPDTYI